MRDIRLDNKKIHFENAAFRISAPDISHLTDDSGIEIAFAGRSNAGKSSALNTLTRQKSLARTSKTPGRTQLINVFEIEEGKRLIDLPGYGFAKVPFEVKKKWQKALGEYLQKRQSLKGIVVLMDIRHPLKDLDKQLILWAIDSDIPVMALLTKADKLKQGVRSKTVKEVKEAVKEFGGDVTVAPFSSLKHTGIDVLKNKLCEWYDLEPAMGMPSEDDEEFDDSDFEYVNED